MNMHTFRQTALSKPETMNWTPVEAPITEATDKAATQVSKDMPGMHLIRWAYRVGIRWASALMFLMLGATGLWAVVDLAKIVVSSFKDK